MTDKLLATIILAICVTSVASPAYPQISRPEPIDTPVRAEWRAPFEGFLRELGIRNPNAITGKTNAFEIGGIWHPNSILFRVEDPPVCSQDQCFTVIGRIADNKFAADAMFAAGKRFTRGDQFVPFFGFQTIHAWLVGDKVTIALLETPKGWMVAPLNHPLDAPP